MSEERTITIDDVARLAGVSRATAGRVVGNYGSVSDKAKERVLEAVRQLDYQPNLIARGLRSIHKWKKNTLLSIGGGTVLYMILVQTVFR